MILSCQHDVTERGVGKRDLQLVHESWYEPALVAHLGDLGKSSFRVVVQVEAGGGGGQMQEQRGRE